MPAPGNADLWLLVLDLGQDPLAQMEEVRRILLGCYERAKTILRGNMEALHKIAEALLERESLDGAEIDEILQRCAVTPPQAGGPAAATA